MLEDKIPTEVHIAILEIKPRLNPGTVEDVLRQAMRLVKDHWLCASDDHRFRAAVGAAMLHFGPGTPEFLRIGKEMLQLRTLSAALAAAQSGVHVDMLSAIPSKEDTDDNVGLLKLWHEVKADES